MERFDLGQKCVRGKQYLFYYTNNFENDSKTLEEYIFKNLPPKQKSPAEY